MNNLSFPAAGDTASIVAGIDVLKQNHVRVSACGMEIHVDPFRAEAAPRNADFVLITHDHHDHFSLKDVESVACANTVLVVPENMRAKAAAAEGIVGKIVTVKPGEAYTVEGIAANVSAEQAEGAAAENGCGAKLLELETVPSYNVGKPFHPRSAGWVGYVLKIAGQRVYIAGDTDATEEAAAVKCDVALVPAGGTYTMNAKQAAELVNRIRPRVAIPVHYGDIVGRAKDGETFRDAVDEGIEVVLKIRF